MQSTQSQEIIYQSLVQTAAQFICWSSVEGVSLASFRLRLSQLEQQAKNASLPVEAIRLALQIGEYQGRFTM